MCISSRYFYYISSWFWIKIPHSIHIAMRSIKDFNGGKYKIIISTDKLITNAISTRILKFTK